jgi:hypothetical protein
MFSTVGVNVFTVLATALFMGVPLMRALVAAVLLTTSFFTTVLLADAYIASVAVLVRARGRSSARLGDVPSHPRGQAIRQGGVGGRIRSSNRYLTGLGVA